VGRRASSLFPQAPVELLMMVVVARTSPVMWSILRTVVLSIILLNGSSFPFFYLFFYLFFFILFYFILFFFYYYYYPFRHTSETLSTLSHPVVLSPIKSLTLFFPFVIALRRNSVEISLTFSDSPMQILNSRDFRKALDFSYKSSWEKVCTRLRIIFFLSF
jgi:hypothetical protein